MSTLSLIFTGLLVLTTISGTLGSPVKRQVATTTPITYQQFLSLPINATRAQITQRLNNNPGVLISEMLIIPNYDLQTIQYTNPNPIAVISLALINGLLSSKSQSGLSPTKYSMTYSQFTQITMGATIAQVQSLFGNGEVVAIGTNTITYNYVGNTTSYASAQIAYTLGKVTSKFEYGL